MAHPISHFVKASELLDQKRHQSDTPLSTGFPRLDELLGGGVRGGSSYLFYDDSGGFLRNVIPSLIVEAAARARVAYMNDTDYYSEKTLVQPNLLAALAKGKGLDPKIVFTRVYFVAAYNELRQEKSMMALLEMLGEQGEGTKLVVMHNLARFIEGAKDRKRAVESLNRSLVPVWQLAAKQGVALVITVHASLTNKKWWTVQRPSGSHLLWHLANVIVSFRGHGDCERSVATLVEHPSRPTPLELFSGSEPLMGRLTPSFTRVYFELLDGLRKRYAPLLRDGGHRDAFEALVRDGWDRERAAMFNAETPLALDALNLTASVHNKSLLECLERRLRVIEERLARIESQRKEG